MNRKTIRTVASTSCLLPLAILMVACGNNTGSDADSVKRTSRPECVLSQPMITAETPTIAILGATGPDLSSFQQDIAMVIASAATQKAHVIINGVSDGTDSPNLLGNVVLNGEGDNNLERTQDLKCKTAVVNDAIATLQKADSPKQPNAFGAISTLVGNLDKDPSEQPVDVVLLTPLNARAGGIDLNEPGTLDDPVAAINTLATQGLIPTCTNYRFYGVSPAVGMSDVEAAKLREFWLLYSKKCGGEFVAWSDHLSTFPLVSAITPADVSPMKVDRTPTTVTATLGSDVLFGADSAQLQSEAIPALNELLGLAEQYTGEIVISGFVNPVVPGANSPSDLALSEQRAQVVASWLVAHGVAEPRITTVGKGAADAVYPDPRSDVQRAANRRVVVAIHTQAA